MGKPFCQLNLSIFLEFWRSLELENLKFKSEQPDENRKMWIFGFIEYYDWSKRFWISESEIDQQQPLD